MKYGFIGLFTDAETEAWRDAHPRQFLLAQAVQVGSILALPAAVGILALVVTGRG